MEMKEEDFRPAMAAVWGAAFVKEFYHLLSLAVPPTTRRTRENAADLAAMGADLAVNQAATAWGRRGED